MSQYDLLRGEIMDNLQCSICFGSFTQPKVVGTCQHTFCRECLRSSIERQRRDGDSFSCPLCQRLCTLPQGGVEELPDNLVIANISAVLTRTQRRRTLSRSGSSGLSSYDQILDPCAVCKGNGVNARAAFVCEVCENRLCEKCKELHASNIDTSAHTVIEIVVKKNFGVCWSHPGELLEFFCHECEKAVCSLCKSAHTGLHVGELTDVISDYKEDLTRQISETKVAILKTVAEEHKLVDIRNVIYEDMNNLMQDIQARGEFLKSSIDKQIEKLMMNIKADCDVTDIDIVLLELENERQKMENLEGRGEILEKSEIMTPEDLQKLKEVNNDMKKATVVEVIDYEQYKERLAKLPTFVPGTGDVNIGVLHRQDLDLKEGVIEELPPTEIIEAKFKTTSFRKLLGLHFPANLQCSDVRTVTYLPYERFAVLASLPGDLQPIDTIFVSQAGTDGVCHVCRMVSDGIGPAEDMAVTTRGELAVVRREKPYIRLVDPEKGTSRSINIRDDLEGPWSIAMDGRGRYVLLDGWPECHAVIVSENGDVLQTVDVAGEHWRIASYGSMIYSCGEWQISACRIQGDSVEKMMSFQHGVGGIFTVTDICALKEHVYVAGRAGEGEICVFEVAECERNGEKFWDMRGVALLDGKGEDLDLKADGWRVSIDIRDNKLLLGYNDNLGHVSLVTLVFVE